MRGLSRQEQTERARLVVALNQAAEVLGAAVNAFNEQMAGALAPVEAAQEAYNAVAEEAKAFTDAIGSDAEGEYADRSERWQESDKGQTLRAFADEWRNVEIEPVEIEPPAEIELPDLGAGDALDALPVKPE